MSELSSRWLRLTRSGDTITGDESTDGVQWTKVGTVAFSGLPERAQVGLFVSSPADLTLESAGPGTVASERFTQATAVFDNITVDGAPAAKWSGDAVGEMGRTDWERYTRAPGLVETNGTFTVTGSGDIGPADPMGRHAVEDTLVGLAVGLTIVIVAAVRFMTGQYRPGPTGVTPLRARVLAAKAIVIGAVTFLAGLVAAGVVVPVGTSIMRANGSRGLTVSALTELRLVVGVAALVAVAAVFALALGALLRRTWVAILVAISAVVAPYVLGVSPLLPDDVSSWLLRLTPAAGFAVQQTVREYPQVVGHYAPSAGYFPLPGWAGFAVLCGYTAAVLGLVVFRLRRRTVASSPGPKWR